MILKNTGQQNWIYKFTYAVVHSLWIAAFFVSTGFDAFQHAPPGTVFEYTCLCALVFGWVRFLLHFLSDYDSGICPRCRSPPSDFDFANHQKSKFGGS